jgi:hypothetical protein
MKSIFIWTPAALIACAASAGIARYVSRNPVTVEMTLTTYDQQGHAKVETPLLIRTNDFDHCRGVLSWKYSDLIEQRLKPPYTVRATCSDGTKYSQCVASQGARTLTCS